jgi:endonuclease G
MKDERALLSTARAIAFIAAAFILCSFAFAQSPHFPLGAPSPCEVIEHTGFALCYSEEHEQATWVAYELTRAEAEGNRASRKGEDFEPDPAVTTGSAVKDDYRRSGWDRGHLAPATDMKWCAKAMRESFLFSNICPQNHDMNGGVWNDLEAAVREAAKRFGAVQIITGPVLREGLPVLGRNRVSIPEYFYKALYAEIGGQSAAIGFVIPNAPTDLPFTAFAVAVDSVENLTGLDFFHRLDDETGDAVERGADVEQWFGKAAQKPSRKP